MTKTNAACIIWRCVNRIRQTPEWRAHEPTSQALDALARQLAAEEGISYEDATTVDGRLWSIEVSESPVTPAETAKMNKIADLLLEQTINPNQRCDSM